MKRRTFLAQIGAVAISRPLAALAQQHGGRRSGAGRKKGVPNKLTADVSAIMQAFKEVGAAEYPACALRPAHVH